MKKIILIILAMSALLTAKTQMVVLEEDLFLSEEGVIKVSTFSSKEIVSDIDTYISKRTGCNKFSVIGYGIEYYYKRNNREKILIDCKD